MNVKIIGLGAAGNKASVRAVSNGLLKEEDVLLLNTAIQDIAQEYKSRSVIFNKGGSGGCGKERARSKDLIVKALQDGFLTKDLNSFINPGDLVIIVTSTEGGTGSGAAPVLAAYINEVIGTRPQLIAFTGTEDDLRGLQNTADFFKDCANMCADCTIQAISNKKFMTDANGNKLKAEILANDEFVSRVKVLQGSVIRESEQNIDAMDHRKLVTTPGYMSIMVHSTQEPIETVDQFNKLCDSIVASSKSLSTSGTKMTRLGVIATLSDTDKENVDWSFDKIKSAFGIVGEVYTHVQKPLDETRQIIIVEAGLEMPLDFVMSTYEKFKQRTEKMNSNSTDFLSRLGQLDTAGSSLDFDRDELSGGKTKTSDFFNKISGTKNNSGFKNTKTDDTISNV